MNLLSATDLCAGYNGHPYVRDVTLEVAEGEIVAVLGANGAGKTTTLLALSGELKPLSGRVSVIGQPKQASLPRNVKRGLAFIGDERSLFMRMTVRQNLSVGRCAPVRVFELFPELEPLIDRRVGLLSGGEQQMLSIGRALARRPRLLLVDELSLGLAPLIVARILAAIRSAADAGLGVLMVEQHAQPALRVADRAYVLDRGRVAASGPAAEVRHSLADVYLSRDRPGNSPFSK